MDTSNDGTGLLIGGILSALLIPIIGYIIAIVMFAKNRIGHGLAVLLTTPFAALVWIMILGVYGG